MTSYVGERVLRLYYRPPFEVAARGCGTIQLYESRSVEAESGFLGRDTGSPDPPQQVPGGFFTFLDSADQPSKISECFDDFLWIEELPAIEAMSAQTEKEDAAKPANTITFNAPECKIDSVVVYLDRAEVCRSIKTDLRDGENEIIVKQLSEWIDRDSIRVEGKGNATITEVSFQTKYVSNTEEESAGVKELRSNIAILKNREKVLNTKQKRLNKQRSLLDGFADKLIKQGPASNDNDAKAIKIEKSTMEGMVNFFQMYDKQACGLDEGIHELNLEIEALAKELKIAQKNLEEQNASQNAKQEAREVSILLDAAEDCEVELLVSYVVSKAKWSPKYDIRVFSNENKMKIQYYGLIQQATGEDWEDAKLSLTTAMPSIGGTVPDLGTQKVFFKPKMRNHYRLNNKIASLQRKAKHARRSWSFGTHDRTKQKKSTSSDEADTKAEVVLLKYAEIADEQDKAAAAGETPANETANEDVQEGKEEVKEEPPKEEPPKEEPAKEEEDVLVEIPEQEVKESVTSTSYEVARSTTIPCDNTSHKVSVALIDLTPSFEYHCVPKKAAHAFLKAKVKNTSQYALLAGPTNIFLDNNFVAKAELKAVSPSEEFTCSLGVDPGVRVNYKPLHKYREQSGVISKTASTTYHQELVIKNTHADSIHIIVQEQLPLSMEEKIKVNLVEPHIKSSKGTTPRLNKQNNVQWELDIAASESKELSMKYTIDHPVQEEVDFMVAHENPV